MAELTLLPRKEFSISFGENPGIPELKGLTVSGIFNLWAAKRFCEKQNLSLAGFAEKMGAESITIDDICQFILCAVESRSRKDRKGFAFSDVDACDWIEEIGGIGSENYNKLIAHAQGEAEGGDEKKSLLSGQNLSEPVIGQA